MPLRSQSRSLKLNAETDYDNLVRMEKAIGAKPTLCGSVMYAARVLRQTISMSGCAIEMRSQSAKPTIPRRKQ